MYARCLFCQADLGRNEAIEAFPVGRRLAYDAARGRLWVVCRACERWNLTPLDERWEAIEAAERLYRDTRRRVATENVGLARVADGTELVRIGRPLRPEFAAWRYGDQFGRRQRRAIAMGVGTVGAAGAAVVAGPVLGLVSLSTVWPLLNSVNVLLNARRSKRVLSVPVSPARTLRVAAMHAQRARLVPFGEARWRLEVHGVLPDDASAERWLTMDQPTRSVILEGEDALRAAATLLPRVNHAGGSARTVRDAVAMLDETPDPATLFERVADDERRRFYGRSWQLGEDGVVSRFPTAVRLALEMAAHEERERRALEGELAELERAWREAEEIATIADALLVPGSVTDRLRRLRGSG
ncbi:hypothetical protein [Roseisolibacter agri]|uniref:Uncharacterized protein n=1 Tax=Roseisolibacter agri TaxID=2014610 RepID=A0AA37Q4J5_9BACT|nr:hypothetical protein [Roseisolibacter agri]GLC24487.1 hypothetical protein rosag_10000 [Roseisolibacter agri]